MTVFILIVALIVCVLSILSMLKQSKRVNDWHAAGVNMGRRAEEGDILMVLGNLKLPEEREVRIDPAQGIIIYVNKTPYRVIAQEDANGNTIVRFALASGAPEGKFEGIELVWLYEYFQDEIMNTNQAKIFYKQSNGSARWLLLGGFAAVVCIIILIIGAMTG